MGHTSSAGAHHPNVSRLWGLRTQLRLVALQQLLSKGLELCVRLQPDRGVTLARWLVEVRKARHACIMQPGRE